jgi:hypothetical protein
MGLRNKQKKSKGEKGGGFKWDSLPWVTVDTNDNDGLMSGNAGEAMFYGLEELDGNAYTSSLSSSRSKVTAAGADGEGEGEDAGTEQLKESSSSRKKESKKRKREEAAQQERAAKKEAKREAPPVESTSDGEVMQLERREKDGSKKEKPKKKKKNKNETAAALAKQPNNEMAGGPKLEFDFVKNEDKDWSGTVLHAALVDSLLALHFQSPTRIQALAMPGILAGACDVVGSSETGSGKTLAFGLPIVHSLLHEWEAYGNSKCPFALILAPTRELAMQISSVLNDTCKLFKTSQRRIEVVNVVGGMSEHKQKRQLDGTKGSRPVHIMVATPGRLCELMTNSGEDMVAFSNLSSIRYLVVDEADRMVEEGHFPELYRIFSRIRDHEKMVQQGIDPVAALKQARRGTDEDANYAGGEAGEGDADADADDDEIHDGMDLVMLPPELGGAPLDPNSASRKSKKGKGRPAKEAKGAAPLVKPRQTLLFSATLLNAMAAMETFKKNKGRDGGSKSEPQLRPMHANEITCGKSQIKQYLPGFLVQLLDAVAVNKNVRIFDASTAHVVAAKAIAAKEAAAADADASAGKKPSAKAGGDKAKAGEDKDRGGATAGEVEELAAVAQMNKVSVADSLQLLPSTLQQYEIRSPMEEKDIMAYYFLSSVSRA